MKKLLAFLAVAGMFTFGLTNPILAQDEPTAVEDAVEEVQETVEAAADSVAEQTEEMVEAVEEGAEDAATALNQEDAAPEREVLSFHQTVKRYFIEGGATFMAFVLVCLIFGLALAFERIIYLNMATANSDKLLQRIEEALNTGGVEEAKKVCRETRGPVASIFYQGLDRSSGNFNEMVKAIEDYGSVEMSKLERGLSWISLFIALAPMLGFMGTVIGMISAFDKIAEANTINASIVAGGIKVALITTVSGLIVAIILQIFYNYILSKIDSLVLDMEESSMDLVDILYKRTQPSK